MPDKKTSKLVSQLEKQAAMVANKRTTVKNMKNFKFTRAQIAKEIPKMVSAYQSGKSSLEPRNAADVQAQILRKRSDKNLAAATALGRTKPGYKVKKIPESFRNDMRSSSEKAAFKKAPASTRELGKAYARKSRRQERGAWEMQNIANRRDQLEGRTLKAAFPNSPAK